MRKRMMRIRKRLFSWLLCGAVLISPLSATGIGHGRTGQRRCHRKKAACASTTRIIPLGAGYSEGTPCGYVCEIYAIRKITENQEL